MIYTVTFNPSLDYVASVENFRTGVINRTVTEAVYPGGKGLNVSRVLRQLGVESVALGFTADFTGEAIKKKMEEAGCRCRFISVERGMSRINLKLRSIQSESEGDSERSCCQEETELNGRGPEIGNEDLQAFYRILEELTAGDYLVLAGSIPGCMSSDAYQQVLERCSGRGIRFVVDATGKLLEKTLIYHPFLIKPNHHEMGEIFRRQITSREELIFYGKKLQQMGARNVLISRAAQGALLIPEEGEVLECEAPTGQAVNSVGAGDSMVAGFLAGYLTTGDYREALYLGVAAGSATAFREDLARKADIVEVREKII